MPPKKTQPPDNLPAQPSVVSPEITATLGTRTRLLTTTGPVVVGRVGMNDLVEIRQTQKSVSDPQGILTFDEALVLGKQEWLPWNISPFEGYLYTIVNARQFMVSPDIFEKLKQEGLVL